MSDKIKFKFPENQSSGNNYFTTLEEKIELSEDDELLINKEGIIRKIKAKTFKGERGEKGERGLNGPQGEKGEKGDPGKNFEYSDFTSEQLEGLRGPEGRPGRDGTGAGDMLGVNNLSDLGDIVVARKNLEVFSKYETGRKIENELAKENFAKKVGGNTFEGEQELLENFFKFNTNINTHVGLRFQKNNKDFFTTALLPNNHLAFSRFVNGEWVDDVININNANGNLGIGTNSPSEKLDIKGLAKASLGFLARNPEFSRYETSLFSNRILFKDAEQDKIVELGYGAYTGDVNLFGFGAPDGKGICIRSQKLVFKDIPTSPVGLSSGMLYRDGNIIKIIP